MEEGDLRTTRGLCSLKLCVGHDKWFVFVFYVFVCYAT